MKNDCKFVGSALVRLSLQLTSPTIHDEVRIWQKYKRISSKLLKKLEIFDSKLKLENTGWGDNRRR